MWRVVSAVVAIVVLAVYVSFTATKPDTVALSGNYSTYPYLRTNSPTPLLSATTQNAVPGDSTTIYSQKSIDERFVGMLLHIKWLMKQEGSSNSEAELKRLDRQILSVMDDVGEDLSDLREEFDTSLLNYTSTPDSILALGQTDEYCLTYESTGTTFEWQTCGSGGGLAATDLDTSSELAAILTDETGSGALVFAGSPTLTGTLTAANANFSGNVGIGTTTPNQKLTLEGNINLSSPTGGIYFDDVKYLYASSDNDSIVFGENAGATFGSGTTMNVALGFEAGRYASSSVADDSIYIGNQAGYNNVGWSNIFLGRTAGYNGVGYSNFFVGDHAGYSSAGNDNVFIGQDAGQNNLGESGVFIGFSAGANSTGLSNNNFFGYSAGENNSGDENNFFGQSAGNNNGGDGINAFGELAGYNNSGSYNNFFGRYAGYSNTGNFNEMIGYQTGQNLRSTSTVAVGAEALFGSGGAYSSLNNVALGYRAGYASANGSGNNILVGYRAADNLTTGNNNIVIGYDIDNTTATTDNALNIGNIIFGTGLDGTGTTLSSGNIGIGTTSPYAKLSVAGNSAFTGQLNLTGTAANIALGSNWLSGDGGDEGIFISSDGKVGVGVNPTGSAAKFIVSEAKSNTSGGAISASADIAANPASNSTAGFSAAYNFAYSQSGNIFSVGSLTGTGGGADHSGTGLLGGAYGLDGYIQNSSSGTITSASTLRLAAFNDNASGVITTLKGIDIYDLSNSGSIANTYGLYIGDLTSGTQTNQAYSIYASDANTRNYFAGNVGIGTTTPAQKLQVFGNIRVGTTGANGCLEDFGGGVIAGTCSSDENLKENIEPIASSTPRSYLEALTALTPVTYNWNEEAAERYSKSMNVANLGLIAQDVETQFPELVSRNEDGYRQVDFRALPFYIIEAVKELWVKVRGIDERVEDLEQENEYLKSRLNQIEDELNIEAPAPPAPEPEPAPELVPETPPQPEVTPIPEPEPEPTPTPEPTPEPVI